jgi:hypothetical protein
MLKTILSDLIELAALAAFVAAIWVLSIAMGG